MINDKYYICTRTSHVPCSALVDFNDKNLMFIVKLLRPQTEYRCACKHYNYPDRKEHSSPLALVNRSCDENIDKRTAVKLSERQQVVKSCREVQHGKISDSAMNTQGGSQKEVHRRAAQQHEHVFAVRDDTFTVGQHSDPAARKNNALYPNSHRASRENMPHFVESTRRVKLHEQTFTAEKKNYRVEKQKRKADTDPCSPDVKAYQDMKLSGL